MVGTTTLASIQALALISKIPPEMCYFFWFVIMLSRGGYVGLHLSFFTVIALTPRVRKPMWVFCQCWVCLYQYCSFLEPREMTTGSGVPWITSRVPSFLLLWKLQSLSNAFLIFLGVPREPFTCILLLKPVFTEATWHLPISVALVPILRNELCPPSPGRGYCHWQRIWVPTSCWRLRGPSSQL